MVCSARSDLLSVIAKINMVGNHSWVKLPELDEVVRQYEAALDWAQPDVPGVVIGVSVATYDLDEPEARAAVEHAREVTGLPATDPVRFGVEPLAEAVRRRREDLAQPVP